MAGGVSRGQQRLTVQVKEHHPGLDRTENSRPERNPGNTSYAAICKIPGKRIYNLLETFGILNYKVIRAQQLSEPEEEGKYLLLEQRSLTGNGA